MANLTSPNISVTFRELGKQGINRGGKGAVGVIVRDAADIDPMVLTRASQTPAALTKDNQNYVKRAFLGYTAAPQKVALFVAGADDQLTQALAYMANQELDYVVGPADADETETQAIAGWVKAQRGAGAKVKAVLPACAADDCAIVNFAAAGMTDGRQTYTAAQYCSRIAGLIAGTPMRLSATYAPLPELTDVERLDKTARDAAVGAGKFILRFDGLKVTTDRAVNSKTTNTDAEGDAFKKIKIVEVMDLIRTDLTRAICDAYIGKLPNSYDNKMLLVTAVREYLTALAEEELIRGDFTADIDAAQQERYLADKGVDVSGMSEQEIRQADTGTNVYLTISLKILDAIEDVTIDITI